MTELIVALDTEEPVWFEILFHRLRVEAGVSFFKLGATALMMQPWWMDKNAASYLRHYDVDVFLDLKVYDTRDTVERIARRAFPHRPRHAVDAGGGDAGQAAGGLLQGVGGWRVDRWRRRILHFASRASCRWGGLPC